MTKEYYYYKINHLLNFGWCSVNASETSMTNQFLGFPYTAHTNISFMVPDMRPLITITTISETLLRY